MEEIGQVDAAEELGPDMVGHRVDDGGAVIAGSMCTRKGRVPLSAWTTARIAWATAATSAPGGSSSRSFCATWSISPAYRASYASATAWSAGLPLFAK